MQVTCTHTPDSIFPSSLSLLLLLSLLSFSPAVDSNERSPNEAPAVIRREKDSQRSEKERRDVTPWKRSLSHLDVRSFFFISPRVFNCRYPLLPPLRPFWLIIGLWLRLWQRMQGMRDVSSSHYNYFQQQFSSIGIHWQHMSHERGTKEQIHDKWM